MPVSANIYENALAAVRPMSVSDYDNENLKAIQTQQALKENALALGGKTADLQDRATVRNALAGLGGNATDADRISALKGTGTGLGFSQADALQKAQQAQLTSSATANKDNASAAETRFKVYGSGFNAIASNPSDQSVDFVISHLEQATGVPAPQLRAQFASAQGDPTKIKQIAEGWGQTFEQKAQQAVQMRGQDITSQTSLATNAATNATSRANNAATVGATIRGQNLTDARAGAALNQGKVPTGYRANADGSLSFIPGGPADPAVSGGKPLTDSQAKALGFGSRMQEADKALNDLAARGVTQPSRAKQALGDTPFLGAAANAVSSPDEQTVEQVQRDFVNAILRRESGAAISSSEFDNARKQYFPQPGDSEQVKQVKAKNRQLATQGVLQEVPSSQRNSLSTPISAHPPEISDLLKKYSN